MENREERIERLKRNLSLMSTLVETPTGNLHEVETMFILHLQHEIDALVDHLIEHKEKHLTRQATFVGMFSAARVDENLGSDFVYC